MKSLSTHRSRRHRNPQTQEQTEQPFFSKTNETPESRSSRPFFQAKLSVGQPGDPYEQEADAVARQVVDQPHAGTPVVQEKEISSVQRLATPEEEKMPGTNDARMEEDKAIQEKPELQRKEAEEEELQAKREEEEPVQMKETDKDELQAKEEEEEPLQTKPAASVPAGASRQVGQKIGQKQGKGQAFSGPALAGMEAAFGADFKNVNIHTDNDAVALNQQLSAQAFTHGEDIFFNAGKYRPETSQGKELLAHELTHVLQQNGGKPKSIQRKENVVTSNEAEAAEAQKIIDRIKTDYGIDVNSESGVEAIKKQYALVPQSVLDTLKVKDWDYKELVALEKALSHFAPILGTKRAESTRSGSDQEITSASKVDQAIDKNSPTGVLDTTTLGEFFAASKNFSMFTAGTGSTVDFTDNKKQLEGTAIHEIAHGLLKYALPDFVKAIKYWTDSNTKSGMEGAEAPITAYGGKNAGEDLSESVMYYFVEPDTLKNGVGDKEKGATGNACPERFAFIEKTVKDWSKPK